VSTIAPLPPMTSEQRMDLFRANLRRYFDPLTPEERRANMVKMAWHRVSVELGLLYANVPVTLKPATKDYPFMKVSLDEGSESLSVRRARLSRERERLWVLYQGLKAIANSDRV
jgi:hypothetical protein